MKNYWIIAICMAFIACEGPVPRKPVKVKTGSFMKESAERSKELLAMEETMIQSIISEDSLRTYYHSANGSWYVYDQQVEADTPTPGSGDLVTMTYDVLSFENDTIYSAEDIGIITYKVDKQPLFPGLRSSVKLLKEGETATFLFPSSLAYGYHGDNHKIGTNVPVKSKITLLKIERQADINQN